MRVLRIANGLLAGALLAQACLREWHEAAITAALVLICFHLRICFAEDARA